MRIKHRTPQDEAAHPYRSDEYPPRMMLRHYMSWAPMELLAGIHDTIIHGHEGELAIIVSYDTLLPFVGGEIHDYEGDRIIDCSFQEHQVYEIFSPGWEDLTDDEIYTTIKNFMLERM